MEVRKSEKCGFHLKHSNFWCVFGVCNEKCPLLSVVFNSTSSCFRVKKMDRFHPPAYIDVFFRQGIYCSSLADYIHRLLRRITILLLSILPYQGDVVSLPNFLVELSHENRFLVG